MFKSRALKDIKKHLFSSAELSTQSIWRLSPCIPFLSTSDSVFHVGFCLGSPRCLLCTLSVGDVCSRNNVPFLFYSSPHTICIQALHVCFVGCMVKVSYIVATSLCVVPFPVMLHPNILFVPTDHCI